MSLVAVSLIATNLIAASQTDVSEIGANLIR
jgi:hypothetical protein